MNASMILKLMPMMVMVVSLAYAAYTVQSLDSTLEPVLNAATAKLAEAKGIVRTATTNAPREAVSTLENTVRDLFQLEKKPGSEKAANKAGSEAAKIEEDPNIGLIQGMSLGATLLQGRTQLAVINGRVYRPGQHLEGRDGRPTPLSLTKVFAKKVVLDAAGKHYVLSYPDNLDSALAARNKRQTEQDPTSLQERDPQLALIQALLRSPLGGLGASLLGSGGRNLISNVDAQLQDARASDLPRGAALARPGLPTQTGPSLLPGLDR